MSSDFSFKLSGSFSSLATTENHAVVANRYSLVLLDYHNRTQRLLSLKRDLNVTNTCIACPTKSCTRILIGYQSGDMALINTEYNSTTLITGPKVSGGPVLDIHWPDSPAGIITSISSHKFSIWDQTSLTQQSIEIESGACVKVHPLDPNLVSTGHQYRAFVWDLRTMTKSCEILAHLCDVHNVSWSQTSPHYLMTCDRKGVTKVHDIRNPSTAVWTTSFDSVKAFIAPLVGGDFTVVHFKSGDVQLLSSYVDPPTVQWRRPASTPGVVRQVSCLTTVNGSTLHVVTLDDQSFVRKYEAKTTKTRCPDSPFTTSGSSPPSNSSSRSMIDLMDIIRQELKCLDKHDSIKVLSQRPSPNNPDAIVVALQVMVGSYSTNCILPPGSIVSIVIRIVLSLEYPMIPPHWAVGPCELVGKYSLTPPVLQRLNNPDIFTREDMVGVETGTLCIASFLTLQEYDSQSFQYYSTGTSVETELAGKSFSLPRELMTSEHIAVCAWSMRDPQPRVVVLPNGVVLTAFKKHDAPPTVHIEHCEILTTPLNTALGAEELEKISRHRDVWRILRPVMSAGPSVALRAAFGVAFTRLLVKERNPIEAAMIVLSVMRLYQKDPRQSPVPFHLLVPCLMTLRRLHTHLECAEDPCRSHEVIVAMQALCVIAQRCSAEHAAYVSEYFGDIFGDGSESRVLVDDALRNPFCVLCCQRVKGIMHFCRLCGHGGHKDHIIQWFETQTECAAGCGCMCVANGGL